MKSELEEGEHYVACLMDDVVVDENPHGEGQFVAHAFEVFLVRFAFH